MLARQVILQKRILLPIKSIIRQEILEMVDHGSDLHYPASRVDRDSKPITSHRQILDPQVHSSQGQWVSLIYRGVSNILPFGV